LKKWRKVLWAHLNVVTWRPTQNRRGCANIHQVNIERCFKLQKKSGGPIITLVKWCYSAGKSLFGVAPAILQYIQYIQGKMPPWVKCGRGNFNFCKLLKVNPFNFEIQVSLYFLLKTVKLQGQCGLWNMRLMNEKPLKSLLIWD